MTDEELYESLRPSVDAAVVNNTRSRDPSYMEDLRQQAYLALVKDRPMLRKLLKENPSAIGGHAYTVAKREIIRFQNRRCERDAIESYQILPGVGGNDDVAARRRDVRNPRSWTDDHGFSHKATAIPPQEPKDSPPDIDIDKALNALSEEQQSVIRGLFYEGRSETEVGEELGLTRWRVRQVKKAALKTMRGRLKN